MSIQGAIDDLVLALDSVAGVHVYAYVPDNIVPPAVIVQLPRTITYHEAVGAERVRVECVVVANRSSDRASHRKLAALLDHASLPAAIEATGPTANYDAALVAEARDVGSLSIATVEYLAATLMVDLVMH